MSIEETLDADDARDNGLDVRVKSLANIGHFA